MQHKPRLKAHCISTAARATPVAIAVSMACAAALAGTPAGRVQVELSEVAQGRGGFIVDGELANVSAGYVVAAAGDVNGDGFGDLLVSAIGADPNGRYSGASYVVFGKADHGRVLLSDVAAGRGGFGINGVTTVRLAGIGADGAGDVNGDGLADLVIEAKSGWDPGNVFVVFGKTDTAAVELSDVELGRGGFVVEGFGLTEYTANVSGAGDVNGDGFADMIVETASDTYYGIAGSAYVVFGKADTDSVDLRQISAGAGGGFEIHDDRVFVGERVAGAGDVNGDGLADLVLGSSHRDNAFVVFGKSTAGPVRLGDIVAGKGGFLIHGRRGSDGDPSDSTGASVAGAGDVNGDGLADVLIGAPKWGPFGEVCVVFGKKDTLRVEMADVAAGHGGFSMRGEGQAVGLRTAAAGDVNGDGLADMLLSAGYYYDYPRQSYVVFGKTDTTAIGMASVLAGIGGFAILSETTCAPRVAGAGDVDGDGLADLILGDPCATSRWNGAGRAYVVFGSTRGAFRDSRIDQVGGRGKDSLVGTPQSDGLAGGAGNDMLTGNGGADVLLGGRGEDVFIVDAANVRALASGFGHGGNKHRLARIDGGTGLDTLRLSGAGITLDLAPGSASRIESIERIDLTGSGANSLMLSARDVQDMAGMNLINRSTQAALGWVNGTYAFPARVARHQLIVQGNASSTLTLRAGASSWIDAGTVFHEGIAYAVYNSVNDGPRLERAQVIVANAVTIVKAP